LDPRKNKPTFKRIDSARYSKYVDVKRMTLHYWNASWLFHSEYGQNGSGSVASDVYSEAPDHSVSYTECCTVRTVSLGCINSNRAGGSLVGVSGNAHIEGLVSATTIGVDGGVSVGFGGDANGGVTATAAGGGDTNDLPGHSTSPSPNQLLAPMALAEVPSRRYGRGWRMNSGVKMMNCVSSILM
jgi:hypothetical protein